MIAVDTSALMAIVLDEPEADDCASVLAANDRLLMSAGTVAEALIVGERRGLGTDIDRMIDGLGVEIIGITAASARRIALAYQRWGKGIHRAGLNLGDCFSYEVAHAHDCPLLFVGSDFALTDVVRALRG